MSMTHSAPRISRAAVALAITVLAALVIAPSALASGVKFFQSPSKNIGCVIARGGHGAGGGGARCDIREHNWPTPPKPHSCHLDYGNGLEVGAHGKGHFTCAGDTVLGNGPVLPYGDSIKFGGYKCKSNTTSMRCHNLKSRHGFSLSREHAITF